MKQFDNLELPNGTRWVNQLSYAPVRQTGFTTTGGGFVIQTQRTTGGRPITLEFPENGAWLSYAEMKMLVNHAQTAGKILMFTWEDFESPVLYDQTQNPPFEFFGVANYDDPTQDKFFGKIHLITLR